MKLTSRITVWFQALVVIGCFSALSAQTKPGTYQAAKVEGTATWTNPKTQEVAPLISGQSLPEGAIISTGMKSSVVLVFASGAVATISADSSLEVTRFSQKDFSADDFLDEKSEPSVSVTELNLLNGEMTGEVRRLRTGSQFNVNTPVGAAGVRGTIFSVNFNAATKVITVRTSTGLVVVLTPSGDSYNVSNDTKVTIEGGTPSTVEALSPNEKAVIEQIAAQANEVFKAFQQASTSAERAKVLKSVTDNIIKTPDVTITVSGDQP